MNILQMMEFFLHVSHVIGDMPPRRRGLFSSVKELITKIDAFVQHYNRSSRPFVWTATADSILRKIARLCSRISGTAH